MEMKKVVGSNMCTHVKTIVGGHRNGGILTLIISYENTVGPRITSNLHLRA